MEEMKRSVLNQIETEASSSSSHQLGSVWMAFICFMVGRSTVHGMDHRSAKCCWAHLGVRQHLNGRALQGLIAWRWMGINIRHPQTETLKILSHKLCCGKAGGHNPNLYQHRAPVIQREAMALLVVFPPSLCSVICFGGGRDLQRCCWCMGSELFLGSASLCFSLIDPPSKYYFAPTSDFLHLQPPAAVLHRSSSAL